MSVEKDHGFTLIEVAVSLALMGLLTLLIVSGLPFLSDSASRMLSTSSDNDELSAVHRLMTHHTTSIVRQEVENSRDGELVFSGSPDQLKIVSMLPLALHEDRGRKVGTVTFRIEGTGENTRLIYEPGMKRYSKNVLVGIQGLSLSYFGSIDRVSGWHDHWTDKRALPSLIRLEGDGIPPMVFRIMLSARGDVS